MTDLNVPQYDARANSNFYAGVTAGSVIGYKNSGTTIPIAGGTIGYEYKDKDNGGFHAGLNVTAGTVLSGKANAGYELRWGDLGLDLSANARGAMSTIANQQNVLVDAGAHVKIQNYVFDIPTTIEMNDKYRPFDYSTGVSGEIVYHGKTEKADYNLAAGVEAGYHGAGPSSKYHINVNQHAEIVTDGTIQDLPAEIAPGVTISAEDNKLMLDIQKTTDVSIDRGRHNPWYVTPTLKADVTFGKNKSWTVKLDANMHEATAGVVYNIPVNKDK